MRTLTSILVAASLALPAAALASTSEREEMLASLPDSAWPDSVTALDERITSLDDRITQLDERITPVERQITEGDQAVIALSSDILFEFDKAEITGTAEKKIAELVTDVPDGATVQVHGHTDSLGTDERNAELSLERAETVAAVIEEARPDLQLEVEGFGPSRPVEPNEVGGEDNPEGRALNRRVEIRYDE
ncbi:OmpA family protein [Ornithinimicrobium panacihumi]|uniref:OmpA family protein n=1 Tax=Ornithinimicrobium panacihumi TaxID=2008449 RepID=UPI003F8B80E5